MRFICLTETGGTSERDMSVICGGPTTTQSTTPSRIEDSCLRVSDFIKMNSHLRFAIYTETGWYIYTGESGFGEWKSNVWLQVVDLSKCNFKVVVCDGECKCEGGGCDCDTIGARLNRMRLQLESDHQAKYDALVTLLEKSATQNNDVDLLALINQLKQEFGKGLIVNLGDDYDNRTTAILMLLSELGDIIRQMKNCEDSELTRSMQSLYDRVMTELKDKKIYVERDGRVNVE